MTIHTAKCDLCNLRNKSTLQRCTLCGWSICEHCWIERREKFVLVDDQGVASPPIKTKTKKRMPAATGWRFEGGHIVNQGDTKWSAKRMNASIGKEDSTTGLLNVEDGPAPAQKGTKRKTAEGTTAPATVAERRSQRIKVSMNNKAVAGGSTSTARGIGPSGLSAGSKPGNIMKVPRKKPPKSPPPPPQPPPEPVPPVPPIPPRYLRAAQKVHRRGIAIESGEEQLSSPDNPPPPPEPTRPPPPPPTESLRGHGTTDPGVVTLPPKKPPPKQPPPTQPYPPSPGPPPPYPPPPPPKSNNTQGVSYLLVTEDGKQENALFHSPHSTTPAAQPGPPPPYPPPSAPPREAHTARLQLDIQVGLAQQDGDGVRTVLTPKRNGVARDADCQEKDQEEADRYDLITLLLDAAATLA